MCFLGNITEYNDRQIMMVLTKDNINDWDRYGRGKCFSFYITENELRNVLIKTFKNTTPKPHIIYSSLESLDGKQYEQVYSQSILSEDFDFEGNNGSYIICLGSLSPNIHLSRGDEETILTYQGSPILDTPGIGNKKITSASLMMVNRIINIRTNEIVENKDYLKVYNHLKSEIKKVLRYKVFEKYSDGSIHEEKNVYMSEGFYKDAVAGKFPTNIVLDHVELI